MVDVYLCDDDYVMDKESVLRDIHAAMWEGEDKQPAFESFVEGRSRWVRYEDYEKDMRAVLVKALENMSMFQEALNVDDDDDKEND